jgi:hypothetical protein
MYLYIYLLVLSYNPDENPVLQAPPSTSPPSTSPPALQMGVRGGAIPLRSPAISSLINGTSIRSYVPK